MTILHRKPADKGEEFCGPMAGSLGLRAIPCVSKDATYDRGEFTVTKTHEA